MSDIDPIIEPGVYRHYKGPEYRVLGTARHSETLELLVVYETLYECAMGNLWVRPLSMFAGSVVVDGQEVPRFAFVRQSEGFPTAKDQGPNRKSD